MPIEHFFDLNRGNILAPRDDDVLRAIFDLDVVLGVHHAKIPGVKPAVGQRFGGGLGILEVAAHDHIAFEHDLAEGLAVARHRLQRFRIHHVQIL